LARATFAHFALHTAGKFVTINSQGFSLLSLFKSKGQFIFV